MQVIDLFSGIGGFSLAAKWAGWETIQFCEIDKFCQKILAYHFPNVPIHDNVKTLNYEEIKKRINPSKPTIVVGGFPCQPYSLAGKRLGKEDDRHLWPYCVETIRQLKPNYCVFENVFGIVNWNGGLVFDEVQSDLEAEGYEVQAFVLPACAVNAPHRRDRIWFVAYADNSGIERRQGVGGIQQETIRESEQTESFGTFGENRLTPDTSSDRRERTRQGFFLVTTITASE